MANYILVDFMEDRENLLPLTYTRTVSKLRCGILTLDEKWKHYLNCENISYKTAPYLQKKFKLVDAAYNIYINASVLAGRNLARQVKELKTGELLQNEGIFIAAHVTRNGLEKIALLTTREIEILKLICEGYSNKEIAAKLFISHRTVDTHRTNLMTKLDLNNVVQLTWFAIRSGICTL